MGEHAEDALDQMWQFAHDSYGDDFPTSIRCRYCGKGPFDWHRTGPWRDPRWRLFDGAGVMHTCVGPAPAADASEFPIVE